jgi:hypothetical protein
MGSKRERGITLSLEGKPVSNSVIVKNRLSFTEGKGAFLWLFRQAEQLYSSGRFGDALSKPALHKKEPLFRWVT